MMLNLYELHSSPGQLKGYDQAHERIPEFVWERYENQPEQLKKHEHVLAKDPRTAFNYAWLILGGRFPEGENAIGQSPEYSYLYAIDVLQNRFPEGEDAIAQSRYEAYFYAINVLNDRFLQGEDIIKQYKQLWAQYKQRFGIDDA